MYLLLRQNLQRKEEDILKWFSKYFSACKVLMFTEHACCLSFPDERIHMSDKLHHNDFKDEPAMFIYTSGTTGRPKVRPEFINTVVKS